MDQDQLKEYMDTATPEQRLALAKAGMMMAIMQEKLRMGFTNEEVALVLALDDENAVDEDLKAAWQKRLQRFEDALGDDIRVSSAVE